MLKQLEFYLRHSMNDLKVNGRLTFFALLAVAAGVAAIVSLQTLSVMIGDTLSGNLQEINRGDISALIRGDNDTEEGIAEGVLIEEEISIFGQSETAIHVSEQGLDIIQEWIAEGDFAGQVDITYQMALTDIIGQITGSGVGTMVMATETGEQASQVVPIMIDSNVYPFSIPSPKNRRLNGL